MELSYGTDKVVLIPSKCLSLTWYLILTAVFLYIAGYALLWSKGYQMVSPIQSVVVTKVKGVLRSSEGVWDGDIYRRVWDANDVVTPAHGGENGGFFVLTNLLITPNQTRGLCSEDELVEGATCVADKDCRSGRALKIGNGILTGKCVKNEHNPKVNTCQIEGWCPVESHHPRPTEGGRPLLLETREFTVLVKNSIEFSAFGFKLRNIREGVKEDYLQNCLYHKVKDPLCPTFRLWDIVDGAGENYERVGMTGGVFSLGIRWDCDFDWGSPADCTPAYSFSRLDNPHVVLSPGFNFRSAVFHEENRRTLTQNFGLKFLINVEGEGRRFDSVKFLLAVGASIGLFALGTVICDVIFRVMCAVNAWVEWGWCQGLRADMKYDSSHLQGDQWKEGRDSQIPTQLQQLI